jgi:hypothetical protein
MQLDILGQKMIAFDRFRSRGAYVRGTIHINPFETSWQIPRPCAWSIRKTEIHTKNDQDLYPSPQAGFGGCSQPRGRALSQYREVIMPIRLSCRDKLRNRVQLVEYEEVNTLLASDPKASYMDRKTHFRSLYGSV